MSRVGGESRRLPILGECGGVWELCFESFGVQERIGKTAGKGRIQMMTTINFCSDYTPEEEGS